MLSNDIKYDMFKISSVFSAEVHGISAGLEVMSREQRNSIVQELSQAIPVGGIAEKTYYKCGNIYIITQHIHKQKYQNILQYAENVPRHTKYQAAARRQPGPEQGSRLGAGPGLAGPGRRLVFCIFIYIYIYIGIIFV